ncbi:DUF4138 domain-containing protein [Pedobacter aquatilis]|uniref:DUF4138 domain-containing protein n=1 Tax=Pedobacter aquatilis TaxID=351343 RepID=UPI0025B59982|nr:DUF4138 domain-containing protein [Pedobacter aquatilis]MDN3586167.1 DUF4138 domain-containing protein [Pedobacter aquatilis]
MKPHLIFQLFMLLVFTSLPKSHSAELPVVYIGSDNTLHFRSPEPIIYVDLPKSKLTGDLPLKNLLRVCLTDAFISKGELISDDILGVITITGEHFFAQYKIALAASKDRQADSEIEILPTHMLPLIPALPSLSTPQMHAKSIALISTREARPLGIVKSQGITLKVNQIKTVGELIFLDIGFKNSTALGYDIEDLSFVVADKKIYKASNFQAFNLSPKFILSNLRGFTTQARNIYVLPKASFSPAKRLKITLIEKQPSPRVVSLALSYGELLRAEPF